MIELKEYDAVIFDMDGVLIDSEPLWKIAMENTFHSVGCLITKEDFQHTVGLRIDEVVEYWYKQVGWENYTAKEVEHKIIEKMIVLIRQKGEPLAGVMDTIEYLKTKEIPIGLATSSYAVLIQTVLETLSLEKEFDFVHSAENEKYGKPHPAVFLSVAKKLGVAPHKCLVIEDSLNGIISGKAARMTVVCIPEKTHNPEPKLVLADHTLSSMEEFLKIIKN